MANEQAKVQIDSGLDTSGFEKGYAELQKMLIKAESEILKSAAKQSKAIEDEAQKQIESIRKAENEKIAEIEKGNKEQIENVKETENAKIDEIKNGLQEQIQIIKETPGLDKAAMQEQIQAVKEIENAKTNEIRNGLQEKIKAVKDAKDAEIKAVKDGSKQQENDVKKSMNSQLKTVQDVTKKQLKAVQDFAKNGKQAITDFAKGAARELIGMDQILSAMGQGPAALGKLVVDMGKKAIAALNEMADAWRQQEVAEKALENAAKNNPYLNDRNVRQLKTFADEMQRMTGIDNVQILQTETKLASLGRDQEQIQKIVKAAADMAAAGIMDFDSAVSELNNSYNGVIRSTGKLYPELKNLSKEALASGEAIDIIAGKVAGSAAEAMKTGAGSIKAYENAVGDLKKYIGEGWEQITRPARNWITGLLNDINDVLAKRKSIKDMTTGRTLEGSEKILALEIELHNLEKVRGKAAGDRRKAIREEINLLEKAEEQERMRLEDRLKSLNVYDEELKVLYKIEAGEATKKDLRFYEERIRLGRTFITVEGEIKDVTRENSIYLERQIATYERMRDELQNEVDLTMELREIQTETGDIVLSNEDKLNDLRKEYEKKLKQQTFEIFKQAELEGKSADSLEVQNQLLSAKMSAYKSLLSSSEGLLTGELEYEQAIEQTLKALNEKAAVEKLTDEERKKRLADLVKEQETAQKKLLEILTDVQGDARILEEERIQRYISDLKLKSAKEGIEAQYAHELRLLLDLQKEKIDLLNENQNIALNAQRELEEEAIKNAKGNESLITQIKEQGEKDRAEIINNYNNSIDQLRANSAEKEEEIERQKTEAIKQMHYQLFQDIVSMAQEHINALGSIANNITSIWTNNIDRETEAKLKANKEAVQSDEKRAAEEKKIMIEAAYEKYKIDLFTWTSNVTMAAAQAAMAVANALATQPFMPMGPIMAGIAATMGAMQVAAVISSRPKPPAAFASGGVVPGNSYSGDKVSALVNSGEVITTQKQFGNIMKGFENIANMRGGGQPEMVVNVQNNAANMVTTSTRMDTDGLRVVIEQVVGDALGKGRLDDSLTMQQGHAGGEIVT